MSKAASKKKTTRTSESMGLCSACRYGWTNEMGVVICRKSPPVVVRELNDGTFLSAYPESVDGLGCWEFKSPYLIT